jgi:hypothetical protein
MMCSSRKLTAFGENSAGKAQNMMSEGWASSWASFGRPGQGLHRPLIERPTQHDGEVFPRCSPRTQA